VTRSYFILKFAFFLFLAAVVGKDQEISKRNFSKFEKEAGNMKTLSESQVHIATADSLAEEKEVIN
jgi:hypothetical protein